MKPLHPVEQMGENPNSDTGIQRVVHYLLTILLFGVSSVIGSFFVSLFVLVITFFFIPDAKPFYFASIMFWALLMTPDTERSNRKLALITRLSQGFAEEMGEVVDEKTQEEIDAAFTRGIWAVSVTYIYYSTLFGIATFGSYWLYQSGHIALWVFAVIVPIGIEHYTLRLFGTSVITGFYDGLLEISSRSLGTPEEHVRTFEKQLRD